MQDIRPRLIELKYLPPHLILRGLRNLILSLQSHYLDQFETDSIQLTLDIKALSKEKFSLPWGTLRNWWWLKPTYSPDYPLPENPKGVRDDIKRNFSHCTPDQMTLLLTIQSLSFIADQREKFVTERTLKGMVPTYVENTIKRTLVQQCLNYVTWVEGISTKFDDPALKLGFKSDSPKPREVALWSELILLWVSISYLIGSILAPGSNRMLGQKAGAILLTSLSLTTTALIIFMAFSSEFNPKEVVGISNWFSLEAGDILWTLGIDSFTLTILIAVSLVGSFVAVYSAWYMSRDPGVLRFLALVLLFVHFMIWLVQANTLAILFLGWEGIGVTSFLLVSFWSTRGLAIQAGIQAFLINRMGDMLLILSLVVLVTSTGSWSLPLLSELSMLDEGINLEMGLCLLLGGAIGKSAQVGLHAWLPNAIEAPTPVSALIHAATLVTAGVYLIARLGPSLMKTESAGYVCLIGGTSIVFAGLIGLSQTDFKRVIAFSTISQVGYIVLGCGLGLFQMSVFILFTHAFYKALLFLGAGAVIHATADIQDVRILGAEGAFLPSTKVMFIAASLSLGASPYTSGDFSKDVLIELSAGTQMSSKNTMWIVSVMAAGLTATYTGRLIRLVFIAEPRGVAPTPQHDLPIGLSALLGILVVCSAAGGYIGSTAFELSLLSSIADFPHTSVTWALEYQTSSFSLTLPLLCGVIGLFVGTGDPGLLDSGKSSNSRWISASRSLGGWEHTVNTLISRPIIHLARRAHKYQDSGIVELAGPTGLASSIYSSSLGFLSVGLHLLISVFILSLVIPALLNL